SSRKRRKREKDLEFKHLRLNEHEYG
ncbi:hypothetical protein EZS27_042551, partial [termite gut metagenome]